MKIDVLVLVLFIITETLQFSDGEILSLALCRNGSEVNYESYTDIVIRNCGCAKWESCIRKCCQKGYSYEYSDNSKIGTNVSVCTKHESKPFSVPVYDGTEKVRDETDNFLIGMLNCSTANLHYIRGNESDIQKFYVQENGTLHYPNGDVIASNERYCLDENNGLTVFWCNVSDDENNGSAVSWNQAPDENKVEALIHVSAKLISVPFLLATGFVYALLPERNLHRISLMLHVCSLLLGQALFAIGQYIYIEDDTLCLCLGHSILFFMVASFFWMNVICIDIWLAFSGLRGYYAQEKLEPKIFAVASLYSWGFPALNVLIVFLLNTYGNEHEKYYPGIGEESCFLKEVPTIIFYFGPILILILINLMLFIITAVNIQKVKKEARIVHNSQHSKCSNKEDDKLKLYWKLLFVMGLNPVVNTHVIQLISWSLGRKMKHETVVYIWYFKDFSHAAYGILIFIIFVCQKKIWISLKQRFHCTVPRSNTNSKISNTTSTNTSDSENGLPAVRLKRITKTNTDVS